MKNDLEKMRKEFEEKYALAKKENELEEKCSGYYFIVCKGGCYNNGIWKDLKFGYLFGEFRHFYIKVIIYISKIKKSLKTQIK